MPATFDKNQWYAVSASEALSAGAVMRAWLFGEERAVWRDASGAAHVWRNRCLHRGMRLHHGFVEGDRLACRYHGWRFRADGVCVHFPAHPDMTPPGDYCIESHPLAERHGLIWTTIGDSPAAVPGVPALDEFEGRLTFCRTISMGRPAQVAAASIDGDQHTNGLVISSPAIPGTDEMLVIALQPTGETGTQAHIFAADIAKEEAPMRRKHVSAWARQWRWQVENGIA